MLCFLGNVMITSGKGEMPRPSISRLTEVIDLTDPKNHWLVSKCDLDEPARWESVAAFLNNQPLICGGNSPNVLSNVTSWIRPKTIDNFEGPEDYIGQPCRLIPMCTMRAWASSIVLNEISRSESLEESGSTYFEYLLRNNESEILWITGGIQHNSDLHSSTEFITLSESQLYSRIIGPELPFTIGGHCMIDYDSKTIFIIGGKQGGVEVSQEAVSKKTWIVDPTNGFRIKEGPSLNMARAGHCCGKMVVDGKIILVAVGGIGTDRRLMDSVELLDPSSLEQGWKIGKML